MAVTFFSDQGIRSSCSSIIAIMLGVLKMDVDSCIVAYGQLAKEIFPKEGFLSRSKLGKHGKGVLGKARFDASVLEMRVKEYVSNALKGSPSGDEGPATSKDDTLLDFEATPGSEGPKCKV